MMAPALHFHINCNKSPWLFIRELKSSFVIVVFIAVNQLRFQIMNRLNLPQRLLIELKGELYAIAFERLQLRTVV